jgi:FtsZ-interacting cell division protein ZipA
MTLTEGLIILAAMVMLVLVVQGLWLVWKSRPRKAQAAPTQHESRLGHDERIEPSVDINTGDVTSSIEPTFASHPSPARAQPRIEPMIDATASIVLDRPLASDVIWAHMPPTRRVGHKSLLLEGLNAELAQWEPLQADQQYTQLQMAVQMANRMGVLNEIEYSEFVLKAQKLAEDLGGSIELEDMTLVVAKARELDQFAQAHDAQLVVNLIAEKTTWSIGYIQQIAQRYGLMAGTLPGFFIALLPEPESPPVVTLTYDARLAMSDMAANAGLKQISLTFDVAQHAPEHAPFALWKRLAQQFAADLDAAITDDSGQIIGEEQFTAIENDLQGLYQRLAQYELPAGSLAARRLFS